MEKATQYLFQFGTSKQEMTNFVNQVKSEVENGEVDPIMFQGLINTLVKGLTEALKINMENIDIVGAHEAYGYTFKQKEAGVKYDFSNCNHPNWINYSKTIEDAKQRMKDIESTLKTLKETTTIVENDTGEVYEINPPIRKSTTIIEVR
jgi:hypothetical protein